MLKNVISAVTFYNMRIQIIRSCFTIGVDIKQNKLSLIYKEEDPHREVKEININDNNIVLDIAIHNDRFTLYTVKQKLFQLNKV